MRIGLLASSILAAWLVAAPLAAQDGQDQGVAHGARAPLRDLRIQDEKIPRVLRLAASAPYSSEGTRTCAEIAASVDAITRAMGADADTPNAGKGEGGAAAAAGTRAVMGAIIPGFGLVRVLTGADKQQRRAEAAIYGGAIRRGYLKGLGAARGCKPPAAPTAAARAAKLELPPADGKDDK